MSVARNSRPELIRRRYTQVDDGSRWTVAALIFLALVVLGLLFWWRGQTGASTAVSGASVGVETSQ